MSDEIKMEFKNKEHEDQTKKMPDPPKMAEIVNCKFLNLRVGPGKEYPVGVIAQVGTKVEVELIEGDWAQVHTAMGFKGYALKQFLSL